MIATDTEYNLNSAQAARMLGVTQKTVIRWANHGRFGFMTIKSPKGLRYKFSIAEVDQFIEEYGDELHITPQTAEHVNEKNSNLVEEGIVTEKFSAEFNKKVEEEGTFRKLYKQKTEEVNNLNSKLQTASYHIAQLEEKIKSHIPLLEHNNKIEYFEEQITKFKKILEKEKIINISFFVLSALILLEAIIYLVF